MESRCSQGEAQQRINHMILSWCFESLCQRAACVHPGIIVSEKFVLNSKPQTWSASEA